MATRRRHARLRRAPPPSRTRSEVTHTRKHQTTKRKHRHTDKRNTRRTNEQYKRQKRKELAPPTPPGPARHKHTCHIARHACIATVCEITYMHAHGHGPPHDGIHFGDNACSLKLDSFYVMPCKKNVVLKTKNLHVNYPCISCTNDMLLGLHRKQHKRTTLVQQPTIEHMKHIICNRHVYVTDMCRAS